MEDFYCTQILSNKLRVKKEYESENVVAFHHTDPSYEFHVVIIPKEHINSLLQIKKKHQAVLFEIFQVAAGIMRKCKWGRGMRLITNVGRYQHEKHLHFHVVGGKKVKD